MLNKLFALFVRSSIVFGIGFMGGTIAYEYLTLNIETARLIAGVIWLVGGIFALIKFNHHFRITFLEDIGEKIYAGRKKISKKVRLIINQRNQQKIEDEMLRLKKLYDNAILTEDEYRKKMALLKKQYLYDDGINLGS